MEYKGIRDIGNLFNEFDEDYYRPIKSESAFNSNYIEYESKGDKEKNLSLKEYLYMIKPYLSDMINDHKTPMNLRVDSRNEVINDETQFGEWKIQLIMAINFISYKDSKETRTMHTTSDNIEIMKDSKTDDIINELFESFLRNYQGRLKESIRGSEFIFNSVDLLYYHLQKTSLKEANHTQILLNGYLIKKQQLILKARITTILSIQ